MNYKLQPGLSLKKNIVTVAEDEVNASLKSIDEMNIHEAVHNIRKRFKKIRALARLVRDEMGEENYKNINIFYRDFGRELSELRDLTAHLETIQALRQSYGDHLYANFFNSLTKEIQALRDKLEEELKEKKFFSEYIPRQLRLASKKKVTWPVEKDDIQIILPSIKRVYKRGRKAMLKAEEEPTAAVYHEWRKRVKYLWYQLRLLEDAWPNLFDAWEDEVHSLANFLGDDHDLVVLKEKIENGSLEIPDKQKELLLAIIKKSSENLRKKAHEIGKLIYAEEPKTFKNRIKNYAENGWK
ncbi:hypothetical protein C7S20_11885 [Christiangramia fulva]|uniref:CHAD domain-containing protein n=1 Tax=Christiangramia fulva TaxID=2126553 RepID=A0A2R3Z6K8_9FLAO|nr:CHAD domain-containing protein [Christiangramia fulva]AVR45895.1 hypothetical protein C7S20_11885 [Christiangramia fulva]